MRDFNFTKFLAVGLSVLILFSCNESDDATSQDSYNLENQAYISLVNSRGENLLDETTPGAYSIKEMKLYYLINGESVEVTPDNFPLGDLEITSAPRQLVVFTNASSENVVEETDTYKRVENLAYLQLNSTDTDTIKTQAQVGYSYFTLTKVWYNNQLIWSTENPTTVSVVK